MSSCDVLRCAVCAVIALFVSVCVLWFFLCQAEDGIRGLVRSRGLGDVYKRQPGTGGPAHRVEAQTRRGVAVEPLRRQRE